MSIHSLTKNWIESLRIDYQNQHFDKCHIEVIDHVLNDYPCRPISRVLINKLFLNKTYTYAINEKEIERQWKGKRIFCFISDSDTNLVWRFTLELVDTDKPTFKIVSAYPKDAANQKKFPDEKSCCNSNNKIKKCQEFINRSSRMP